MLQSFHRSLYTISFYPVSYTHLCSNKFVFGNNAPEDNEWWSKEIGDKKDWSFGSSYDTAKGEYDPKLTGIKYENKIKYQPGKIQAMKFKQAMYKLRNLGGKSDTGVVNLSFLSATYYEPKASKEYSFEKYNAGSVSYTHLDVYKRQLLLLQFHFSLQLPPHQILQV